MWKTFKKRFITKISSLLIISIVSIKLYLEELFLPCGGKEKFISLVFATVAHTHCVHSLNHWVADFFTFLAVLYVVFSKV
jgi:hypothetical protein